MNKLIVFDLDGTLIDSVPDIKDCINDMLKKFGHKERQLSEIKQMIGHGARNLVKNAIGEDLTKDQLQARLDYYNDIYTNSGSPKTKIFDGIANVLNEFKARGFLLAVLTNKPQETTDDVYNTYLSEFGFDCVIGQRPEFKIKPDPDALLYLLEKLNVKKENAFFVGDGETDVQVGINAGVKSVAVLWGYRTKNQLESAGATIFANEPKDLLNLIF
ncbi:MAG: HAD family hydrolase [Clostridiales bacterium]|nr:HAD family hydrolase [Clostridiales bacterium]